MSGGGRGEIMIYICYQHLVPSSSYEDLDKKGE